MVNFLHQPYDFYLIFCLDILNSFNVFSLDILNHFKVFISKVTNAGAVIPELWHGRSPIQMVGSVSNETGPL